MKERGTKELKQLKSLSLKIQELTWKSVAVTEKIEKQYVRHTNQGHLPTKVTLVVDFTDEPVIQCDVPIVENTLQIANKWWKWRQTIEANYCK